MTPYAMYRIIPFAVFMAFIGGEELLRFLVKMEFIYLPNNLFLYLYPLRAVTVAIILLAFWKRYDEIRFHDLRHQRNTFLSIGVGILVFILWVNMPWTLGVAGDPAGYNPTVVSENFTKAILIAVRLLGAVVVVPIMEELFWRSFFLRYIINHHIAKIPIGHFSWPSFLFCTMLFGLEHHYVFAGVVAGTAYSLLLYHTRSISLCVLSHGVTNMLLGVYVLQSKQWWFW